jgi:uncharacterized OsmC-like protein
VKDLVNELIHTHLKHEGGYKFSVTFDELPGTFHADEVAPLGNGWGPSPAMMLSSAVGHCLSSSLLFCLEKSKVPVKDVATDVETSLRRNEKGRWRVGDIKVKLNVTISDSDKEKLDMCRSMFEDFCIVTESVREGIKVDVKVEKD